MRALIEDYRNVAYRSLARSVLSNFLLENKKLPFFVAFDSSVLHYKHWTQIVFNPRERGGWKHILERYYNTDSYKQLNNIVSGDPLLSKYATINFLNSLFKKSKEELKKIKKEVSSKDEENPVSTLLNELKNVSPYQAEKVIGEVVSTLEKEAKEILQDIEMAQSFSHIGIPIAELLEKPDEFREKTRNKIIVHLVKFLQKLRFTAPSLKQTKIPTLVGGRPLGVKKLQRFSELSSVLPIEYLDDDILTYRIASRTIRVSERYGSIPNYVVYLDKSGSMAEDIKYVASPTETISVPKISFASASALALAYQLRRVGAKLTLKLFDVEVHDPISDFKQLIDVLVRIKADSGTNITKVLEDAVRNHRDDKIIIVSDGIDIVSEEAVGKAKSENLDITCVFIQTDNQLLRRNFRCVHLKEAKPTILLEI